jgi:diguanylate cyclase
MGRRLNRRAARRGSSAVARRQASVALGVLLVSVGSVALLSVDRLHSAIAAAQGSSSASDLYQDARFYAAQEALELNSSNADGVVAVAHAAHTDAEVALNRTLNQIRASAWISSSQRTSLNEVIVLHAQYERGAASEFALIDAGRSARAARLESTQVVPILDRMTSTLSDSEETQHVSTVAQLRGARREATWLEVGTPVALGLTLLLLAAFILVTRGYRRTLERQALTDELTGLPNRRLFADRVTAALAGARRSGTEPIVMLLDLDRFKEVNDTLGHHCGDQLLIELASRLCEQVRAVDTVARLGGDEFAILVADGGSAAATKAATRILGSLETPFVLAGITVGVEASIGIATAERGDLDRGHDGEMPDLLQQADTAMYEAKKDRCGFRHYGPDSAHSTPTHLTLLGELRQAFDRDELVLHYQPKVAVDTGELLGVEALVRWQHPVHGLLGPDHFIALAEGTTLIHRLTSIVLDKALRLAHDWLDRGIALPVAVNVSARTLLGHGFAASVAAHLVAADVPASLLCLELTESTIMSDPDRALEVLQQLHEMSVRLSVDDFGTGYSSMAYLKVLPVDELKVDRSFVKDMTRDTSDNVLVQSAVDLGHNLGLTVVAEGVEDLETLTALKTIGADIVQGYYLGRPMGADLLAQWMTDHGHRSPLTTQPYEASSKVVAHAWASAHPLNLRETILEAPRVEISPDHH